MSFRVDEDDKGSNRFNQDSSYHSPQQQHQEEYHQAPPDLARLSLYTKTAPGVLEHNQLSPSSSASASNPSSSTASSHHGGLPNISANLQARVLAFQEKRQAQSSSSQQPQAHDPSSNSQSSGTSRIPSSEQSSAHPPPTKTFNSTPLTTTTKKPEPKKKLSAPALQQQQQQKSPEKTPSSSANTGTGTVGTSSMRKIAPPMRLPPSLPQPNGTTSISQPVIPSLSSSIQAARLPRSRPSLSQRRGMKLNVNDITDDNGSNDSGTKNPPRMKLGSVPSSSSVTTSSRMITSSSSNNSSNLIDPGKKKSVAEFIGQKGQLAQQQAPVSQEQPKLHGLFANYSKYVDIKSGSLNFSGKASLHSKGVDFSGGSSFRISIDELEFIGELGRGNYGTVSKVLHKPTSIIMAMKEVRLELDDSKFRQILMELQVLHNCDSDYIVDFYGAFFVEGAVYMCIELMNLGSLDKVYGDGIPEPQLAYIAKCVITGLKQLKDEQNIIHRDVKPTNILMNDLGKIKLCDFGVSGNLVASMARTNIGCQSYMAPERIKSSVPDNMNGEDDISYSVQSDIWSLGLTLLEAAQGKYPLVSENIFAQLKQIVEDDPPQLPAGKFSKEAADFVNLCLVKDPLARSTYAELLEHPWLLRYSDDVKNEQDLIEFLKNSSTASTATTATK